MIVVNIDGSGGQAKYIREANEQKPEEVTVGQTIRWVNRGDCSSYLDKLGNGLISAKDI
jgi:hypothetical protein